MSEVTIDSLLFALIGLMFVGMSIPLIKGRVAPNRFYGYRTAKTLSDPKIWYEVNRLSGADLFLAGVLITVSSLAMLVLGQQLAPRVVAFTLLTVMVLALLGVTVHGWIIIRRI
jgi:uncharacterized membrane protein